MKHRMNRILTAALALCLLLTAAACSKSDTTAQKATVNIGTAATTGALYPIGAAVANLWNEKLPEVQASAQATNGGVDNLNFVAEGEVELGFAVTSIAYQAYKGEGGFAGRPNDKLRIVAGLYYNPNQVVVTADSGIETLADIAGKRFASGAPGSTTVGETQIHLAAAGVPEGGYKEEAVGFTEAVDLMRNKRLDGAWVMAGVPNAAVSEMTGTLGGRLVPMSDALIAAVQAQYPWYAKYTIPAGSYGGQARDVQTTAVKMVLFCSADLDPALVYQLTKCFWENIGVLGQSNASLKLCALDGATTDLVGIPVHEGAARYYDEAGI